MRNLNLPVIVLAFGGLWLSPVSAQIPQLLHYQGRIVSGATNFDGAGLFKFALVGTNQSGSVATLWSNNGSSSTGNEPSAPVNIPVVKGLYAVLLGDTAMPNMTAIPAVVFNNPAVWLRVWFNDGVRGFQQITPDQRIAAVGYAMVAGTVPDGAITAAKLAPGAIQANSISAGQVVKSLNGLKDDVQLAAGANVTITPSGNTLQISSAGGGGATGGISYQTVSSNSVTAQPGGSYLPNSPEQVAITLPASPAIGDVVRVTGLGEGGWRLVQNPGQYIVTDSLGDTAGSVWTPRDSVRDWRSIAASSDGGRLAAVAGAGFGTGNRIYISTNGGVNWIARESDRAWRSIASSADGLKLAAAVANGQIYTSTNGGNTWTPRGDVRNWVSIASSGDGNRLLAAATPGSLYVSTNAGATWNVSFQTNLSWTSVASSASGSNMLAAAYGDYTYVSENGGATWYPAIWTVGNWQTVAIAPDSSWLAYGEYGGRIQSVAVFPSYFLRTVDITNDWQAMAISDDGQTMVAAAYGGQLYITRDRGDSWAATGPTNNWRSVAIAKNAKLIVAVGQSSRIYISMPSTIPGAAGALSGGADAEIELIYLGNNQFRIISATGKFTVDDREPTAIAGWLLGGNSGTTAGRNFLGTTDRQPLEFKVAGTRGLRIEPTFMGVPNIIGGSEQNSIVEGSFACVIAGGGFFNFSSGGEVWPNTINGTWSAIVGGSGNTALGHWNMIGGGGWNTATNSTAGFIGGGFINTLGEGSVGATIPGGICNTASGDGSFAAGINANALHDGSFVWGDNSMSNEGSYARISSTAENQFIVRASGGTKFFSNRDATTGVRLGSGEGAWENLCDRDAKENRVPADARAVLERLATVPIQTWNYKGQKNPVTHIGPMAQDFARAFHVGSDDKHISTLDADGVALAAIQGLHQVVQDKEAQLNEMQRRLATQEKANQELLERFNALERAIQQVMSK